MLVILSDLSSVTGIFLLIKICSLVIPTSSSPITKLLMN